jgi:hypothetical protein
VDLFALAQLRVMGFSDALSRRALVKTGGNHEAAVNWLFEHQESDQKSASNSSNSSGSGDSEAASQNPFYMCSAQEAKLLGGSSGGGGKGAGKCLVNAEALPEGSLCRAALLSPAILLQPEDAATASKISSTRSSSSSSGSSSRSGLNVAQLTPSVLPDLLGAVLPSDWVRGQPAVWLPPTPSSEHDKETAVATVEKKGTKAGPNIGQSNGIGLVAAATNQQLPTLAWFQRLWAYLAQQDSAFKNNNNGSSGSGSSEGNRQQLDSFLLPLLADGWPLVPTNEGVVLPLSRSCGVVSTGALPLPVRELLAAAKVPTLLHGLFSHSTYNDVNGFGYQDSTTAVAAAESVFFFVLRQHLQVFLEIFVKVYLFPGHNNGHFYLYSSFLSTIWLFDRPFAFYLFVLPRHLLLWQRQQIPQACGPRLTFGAISFLSPVLASWPLWALQCDVRAPAAVFC